MEIHGLDMRHLAECGGAVVEIRLCMEEHGLVEKQKPWIWWLTQTTIHTRWKHKWGCHNWGCVWDKIASEWVGAEEWCEKKCGSGIDKRDFVTYAVKNVKNPSCKKDCATFAMMNVKHSAAHSLRIGDIVEPNKERKEPRTIRPPDLSLALRTQGRHFCTNVWRQQCCWNNGPMSTTRWVELLGEKMHVQKTLHSWWKGKKITLWGKMTTMWSTFSENITRRLVTSRT